MQIQPVTSDVADALGLKQAAGALVTEPQSGSPAAKAGVKAGDVIVSIDGATIKDSRELAQKVGTMSPGSSVKLGLIRDGNQQTINVTLAQMPNQQQAQAGSERSRISRNRRRTSGLSLAPARAAGAGSQGVVVTAVDPNGPAAEHGIKAGDVITNVGGTLGIDPERRAKAARPAAEGRQAFGADAGEVGRGHALRGAAARDRLRSDCYRTVCASSRCFDPETRRGGLHARPFFWLGHALVTARNHRGRM